jgi:hypothetical protein
MAAFTLRFARECKASPKPAFASKRLMKHLATFSYYLTAQTPSLWRHKTCPITFSLVVDDFGATYLGHQHARHLVAALETLQPVTTN